MNLMIISQNINCHVVDTRKFYVLRNIEIFVWQKKIISFELESQIRKLLLIKTN